MSQTPKKALSLFDSTCLIVGIIIGAGIYQMAPDIAKGTFCWWGVLAIWLVGGLLSLCGALGYAELATAYPQEGGDYVYLSRAYGRWAGFLFGWVQLAIVRPGDIAVMAFAFAMYAQAIYDPLASSGAAFGRQAYAVAAVVVLTMVNVLGVREGKWTQNLLTSAKALGLLSIVGVAVIAWQVAPTDRPGKPDEQQPGRALVAADDLFRTEGNTTLTVPAPGVLRNDVAARRDSLSASLAGEPPKGESFHLRPDGSFRYTPEEGFRGPAAFSYRASDGQSESNEATARILVAPPSLALALIFVLFTFGGWNEMAYVAAEVKNPRRNIVRALVVGTTAVTVLYLLVNAAFLVTLGYGGMAASGKVATDTVSIVFPSVGAVLISALVCVSALGAVNGLIFTGARISYAVGAEHRAFRPLGQWNPRTGTPIRALVLQGAIAVALIVTLGSFVDTILYTAASVYSFYLATSLAVIVLRFKEPQVERPYRVTGYPLTTLVFCAACGFLIYSALVYKPRIAAISGAILLAGLPIYWLSRSRPVDRAEDKGA